MGKKKSHIALLRPDGAAQLTNPRIDVLPADLEDIIVTRSASDQREVICQQNQNYFQFREIDLEALNNDEPHVGFRVTRASVQLLFFAVYQLGAPLNGEIPTQPLAHAYPFDDNVKDSIAQAHGAPSPAHFFSDGSLILDGSPESYVDLPNGLISDFGNNGITLEIWASLNTNIDSMHIFDFGTSNQGEINTITETFTATDRDTISLIASHPENGAKAVFSAGNELNFVQLITPDTLSLLEMHHIVVAIDDNKRRIHTYLNGHLFGVANSESLAPLAFLDDVNNWLGRSAFSSDPNLKGKIADFKIWQGPLSGNQVFYQFLQGVL